MSQPDQEMEPIIPVEQDMVPFEQTTILGVRLPDNRVAALFSLLCEVLHLDRSGQVRRIKADRAIAHCLIPARIETPGGPQVLNVLIAGAIPTWLSGISLGKVAPELRPTLLAFQREAADVLYRHFFKINAEPAAPPEAERPSAPHRSARRLLYEAIDALYEEQDERFAVVESRQGAFEESQSVLVKRQTAFEEKQVAFEERQVIFEEVQEAMGEHLVETRARLVRLEGREAPRPGTAKRQQPAARPALPSGPLLSKDHLDQAYLLARTERSRSGQRIDTTLRELAEAFGVEDVSDLPDALWDEALSWFWQRAGG